MALLGHRTRLLRVLERTRALPVNVASMIPADVPLPVALEQAGLLTQERFAELVAERVSLSRIVGVPPTNLDARKLVPRDVAERHGMVPLTVAGTTLFVATWDPTDLGMIDELKFLTGYTIEIAVATYDDVIAAQRRNFAPPSVADQIEAMLVGRAPNAEGAPAPSSEIGAMPEPLPPELAQELEAEQEVTGPADDATPDSEIVQQVNAIMLDCARRRTRALVAPGKAEMTVRLFVDDDKGYVEALRLPADQHMQLVRRFGVMCEATPPPTGMRGSVLIRVSGREIAFRVSMERALAGPIVLVETQPGRALYGARVGDQLQHAYVNASNAPPQRKQAAWERALRLAESDGRSAVILDALMGAADDLLDIGLCDLALDLAMRGVAVADVDANSTWVRSVVHDHVANIARLSGFTELEIEHLEIARDRLQTPHSIADLMSARAGLALTYPRVGRSEHALAEIDAAMREDVAAFETRTTMSALLEALKTRCEAGPDARAMIERALAIADELDAKRDARWYRELLWVLLEPMRLAGLLDQAERAARTLNDGVHHDWRNQIKYRRALALTLIERRKVDEAERTLKTCRTMIPHGRVLGPMMQALDDLAWARLREAQGRLGEARDLYAKGLAVAKDEPNMAMRAAALR